MNRRGGFHYRKHMRGKTKYLGLIKIVLFNKIMDDMMHDA
jgi:hypothetical protein